MGMPLRWPTVRSRVLPSIGRAGGASSCASASASSTMPGTASAARLRSRHRSALAALVDREPRSLSEEQLGTLKLLVGVVVEVVQFRRVAQHDRAAATLGGLSIR